MSREKKGRFGIAAEDIPRLFKTFTQLDSRLSRQHNGTGLGLALVQHMARLHGGSVSVESTPGQGSQFTIHLPWREPAGAGQVPSIL
jgi:signal transduction histidine kinase